jgi:KipI family sensor histidine kinase inhibitor
MSNIHHAGDSALLVDLGAADGRSLHAATRVVRALNGVVACITGERSLYVIFDDRHAPDVSSVERALQSTIADVAQSTAVHLLPVSFAPACSLDLDELLAHAALDRAAFMQRLASLELRARHLGFRAGFAYLEGWPEEWRLPRRATSRALVTAGSFAIAATRAGFYPIDSPGGWNVLGRTSATLWNPTISPPNLIAAGDTIIVAPTLVPLAPPPLPQMNTRIDHPVAEIVEPGQLTFVTPACDWSRLDAGLAEGGPFDDVAAALANAAAGNRVDAAVLECTLVGPTLRMLEPATLAWSGGAVTLRVNCVAIDVTRSFVVDRGDVVRIGRLDDSLRGYLALAGGFDSGLPRFMPPRRLSAGDLVGNSRGTAIASSLRITSARRDRLRIRVIAGPHVIEPALLRELTTREWIVTASLDRVGIRLRASGSFSTSPPADLPSIGAQCGSVQWHPDGSLVILGPDHPITGGYLQPLTVARDDRWKLGCVMPEERITLSVENGRRAVERQYP